MKNSTRILDFLRLSALTAAAVVLSLLFGSIFALATSFSPNTALAVALSSNSQNAALPSDNSTDSSLSDTAATRVQNSGFIVTEQSSGRVLFCDGADNRLYPASTTKILTALAVLDVLPLDKVLTVPAEAVGVEGSSIYLAEGEKVTVETLLFGLMMRSGNDAAVTLALAADGNVSKFADRMNRVAKECGAKDSNFVNPHGLHDDNHYTTARDLSLITAKALSNPVFAKIVSTKSISFKPVEEDGKSFHFVNKNKMLSMLDGANGVKTGFTKKSGRCLVSSCRRDGMQLICVALNCPDMWQKSVTLLNNAFSEFYMQSLETALIPQNTDNAAENGSVKAIEVKATFDSDGDFLPRAYPLRRNGSERLDIRLT